MAQKPKAKAKEKKGARSVEAPSSTHETISIRKIANGYIVRRSSYDGKGGGVDSEHFTPTRPDIQVPKAKP